MRSPCWARSWRALCCWRAGENLLLLAGIVLAAWVASGQATWMPSFNNLVFTLVPIVAMLLMCVLVPEPDYYEEDYEGEA